MLVSGGVAGLFKFLFMRTEVRKHEFEKREEDIITKEGKKFKKPVNRITLTKQPDQYRFTNV